MTPDDFETEWEALADFPDDRYRLLIDLGRALPAMEPAFKTDATKVRGCASDVWLYPTRDGTNRLHFAVDSNAEIVKGIAAVILLLVDGRTPEEIDVVGVKARLDGLGLARHLSSNRTQGLASMLMRIGELAAT